jgi:hypothetical protein
VRLLVIDIAGTVQVVKDINESLKEFLVDDM